MRDDNVGELGELATLARYAEAVLDGLRHLSRLHCVTEEVLVVTYGGAPDGGVRGGLRLIELDNTGDGSEMYICVANIVVVVVVVVGCS